jgi:hypothetical protein
MTRKPHHDLPAIPEVSTPQEIEEFDDAGTIESYAFTLDGVGFDEESGSIMQTPPQMMSSPNNHMSRRDELESHRQTCRTLGVPCSEEMSAGSPRESEPESLKSTSTTSVANQMYDVSLNSPEGSRKTLPPRTSKPPRLITRAKIAEITSSYANSVKEMALSFSAKSKKMYVNSKQKLLTQDGAHKVDGTKRQSFHPSKLYPSWFTEANPLIKLTVIMALFFFALLVIVIVAVSKNGAPQPVQSVDSSSLASLSSALNDKSVKTLDTVNATEKVVAETSMPSYAPTFSPTAIPTSEESNYCINKAGRFASSRGKSRDCSWLKPKHLDRECGGLGEEPSELGLNCKLSCKDYNDCVVSEKTGSPTVTPTSKPTNKRRKKKGKTPRPTVAKTTTTSTQSAIIEDADEVYFLDINSKLRPCIWLDIRNPAVRSKRRDENCPSVDVQEVCPVACLDYLDFTVSSTVAATTTLAVAIKEIEEKKDGEVYFTDTTSQQRPCSWLDIRNTNQRTKRREANCVKITVQIICPASCEDYAVPVTVDKRKKNSDIEPDVSASDYVRSHDLVPQDECYDRSGYFLNDAGHPKMCSWLTENAAEAESRRERNCGGGAANATDLGVMCKSSCGFGGVC